jgi:hypothetical protein
MTASVTHADLYLIRRCAIDGMLDDGFGVGHSHHIPGQGKAS